MAICPKCFKEIDCLNVTIKETVHAVWTLEDGYDIDEPAEVNEELWACPECAEKLFSSEEEAVKFFEVSHG